jgi:anaerobic selenocysteine-containing dehydrogenase
VVDVKDGKIIRTRPFHFDWKYKPDEFRPWKIKARGKVFEPPMKSLITPFGIGYKKRIYSPNRILYPLKRVDWDPEGERNPQNRGKSRYRRISWDEATDIIASVATVSTALINLTQEGSGLSSEEKIFLK